MADLFATIPAAARELAKAAAIVKSNEIRDLNKEEALTTDQEDKMEVLYFKSYQDMLDAWPQAPAQDTAVKPTKQVYGFAGLHPINKGLAYGVKTENDVAPVEVDWQTVLVAEKKLAIPGSTLIIQSETPAGMTINTDGGVWLREKATRRITLRHVPEEQWFLVEELRAAKIVSAKLSASARTKLAEIEGAVMKAEATNLVAVAKMFKELGLEPNDAVSQAQASVRRA